jgi:hypothetical protein
MSRPEDFQDVEVALIELLLGEFGVLKPTPGDERVDTVTPAGLAALLPFVRVGLVAGTDDRVTDYSVVDIDVFHGDRESARVLAEVIRTFLSAAPHRAAGFILDTVYTEAKPRPLPWDIADVHRYGATYRITARR